MYNNYFPKDKSSTLNVVAAFRKSKIHIKKSMIWAESINDDDSNDWLSRIRPFNSGPLNSFPTGKKARHPRFSIIIIFKLPFIWNKLIGLIKTDWESKIYFKLKNF